MNKLFSCIAALFFTSINVAEASQAAIPIYEISDVKAAFIQVPLTYEIFRYTRYSDLRDLRVLDAEHNQLPYQLITLKPDQPDAKITRVALPFFPVAVDATPDTLRKLHTSQTQINGDRIQIATSDRVLNNKTPEFYLIDISHIDHAISNLVIEWEQQPANQFLEIELEASRDLQHWVALGRTTLIQLNQSGEEGQANNARTLKHNQINVGISINEYEFLRFKVARGAEQLNVTRIEAHQKINAAGDLQNTAETWSVPGHFAQVQTGVYSANSRTDIKSVAAWEFIRDEVTPAQSLSLSLASNSYGDVIKIFSRSTDKQDWKLLHQGIWFNAQVGEVWQASNAIEIYPNGDRLWRVELSESAKNFQVPALVFTWQPLQLQVVVNDKPPFSLAISNEDTTERNNAQVFSQLIATTSPKWVAAGLIKLNAQAGALPVVDEATRDWKRIIFWAALVAAVIVLLIFSAKLFTQLKVSDTRQ